MATPTAKNVRSAATRSVPECAASESRPRLPVARPVPSLSPISARAARTETSAVRRCAFTGEAYSGNRFERPDDGVLAAREMHERLALDLERRDARELDLRLGGLEVPLRVVDLGAQQAPRAVRRVQAVALREEPLERLGLRVKDLARR